MKTMKCRITGLLCAAIASIGLPPGETCAAPFYTATRHPLIGLYGLPASEDAAIRNKGTAGLQLTTDWANTYFASANAQESLILDVESLRVTLSARYGIGHGAVVGIDIPWLVLGGGILDGVIDSCHEAFGLRSGGRESAPRNRLLAFYRRDGITRLHAGSSSTGIGDVRLTGGWQLLENSGGHNVRLALFGSLKLPTGDASALSGSGSTDLAVWLSSASGLPIPYGRWRAFSEAGLIVMTRGKILPDQQRPLAGFGTLGFGFAPADWIDFKIQANAHTSFYSESEFKQLNAISIQSTMGATLIWSDKTTLDIGLTEDVIVDTSPDIVLHLSLRHTF